MQNLWKKYETGLLKVNFSRDSAFSWLTWALKKEEVQVSG